MAIFAIAFGICQALDLGVSRASAGIMLASIIGFMDAGNFIYTPTDQGVLFGIASAVQAFPASYMEFFYHNIIFLPMSLIFGFMIIKLLKPEKPINSKQYFIEQKQLLGAITVEEKKIIAILVALVIYLFTFQWHHIDMTYGFILAPLIMYFPGFNIGTKEDINNVNYPILLFVIACMSIGSVATAVGMGEFIANAAFPFLAHAGKTSFIGIVWVAVVVLNFLMTPLAEMAALGAPFTQIAVSLGIDPYPMLYAFMNGCRTIIYQAICDFFILTCLPLVKQQLTFQPPLQSLAVWFCLQKVPSTYRY